jgi:hypothetical protein
LQVEIFPAIFLPSFVSLLVANQKQKFTLPQTLEYLEQNAYVVLHGISIFEEFLEHPKSDFLEFSPLGGEEFDHFVEVAGEEEFIGEGFVEEFDVDVADWVNSMQGGSEDEDAGEVVDEVVEDALVLGLGKLNEGLPEANAVGFVLEDDVEEFLVGFAHEFAGHDRDLLLLGGEGVDEELDDAAGLLLDAELDGVLEDHLQRHDADLLVLVPHALVDLLLQMKLDELQIHVL